MKKKIKAAAKAVAAAFTSPTVVKAEEGVAVFVAVRIATSLGGSAAVVDLIYHIAKQLGWA